jgi:hypothetical protein
VAAFTGFFSPIARERSSFFSSLEFLLLAFVEASAAKNTRA